MANFLKSLLAGRSSAPDEFLRAQLTAQAQELASARGWAWMEPVSITSGAHDGEAVWVVRSNIASLGQNLRVMIRKSNGEIVHSGYLPR